MGSEFLPELNEGALYVTFTLPSNTSLTEGRKLTPLLKSIVARTPEVTEQLTQLGRPEDGTDPTLPNNLELFVKLKPMAEWRPGIRSIEDLAAELDRNLDEVPGIESNISQPIRDNVNENIAGQFGEVALKIYGEDLELLQEAARKAKAALEGSRDHRSRDREVGRNATNGDRPRPRRARPLRPRPRRCARLHRDRHGWPRGLGNVGRERRTEVTVRLPQASREDIPAIRRIPVPLKDGTLIPLSGVADVRMGSGRAVITREDGRRYVGLRMNVRNRDLGSFVEEARASVAAAVSLPAGYDVRWGASSKTNKGPWRGCGWWCRFRW